MNYIWIILASGFLLCLSPASCSRCNEPAGKNGDVVVIFAASSLRECVTEIAAEWSRKSGRSHTQQFEATSTLARQIAEGAKADLFLTAAPEWLEKVETQDRFDWLGNRLVLVTRADARETGIRNLTSLALAGEQVPAGKYAAAALEHEGVKLPPRVVYGANVRDVLAKVKEGGVQAGVVYATDAQAEPGVKVAYVFPKNSHPAILYSAGLLNESGRAIFDAMREAWAIDIARKHGFQKLE